MDELGGVTDGDDFSEGSEEDRDRTKEDDEVKPTPFMRCALPFRELPQDDTPEDIDMNEGEFLCRHFFQNNYDLSIFV